MIKEHQNNALRRLELIKICLLDITIFASGRTVVLDNGILDVTFEKL